MKFAGPATQDVIDALRSMCKHRRELQELFDLKFAELKFQKHKYKANRTELELSKFEQVYNDLDKLMSLCDYITTTEAED